MKISKVGMLSACGLLVLCSLAFMAEWAKPIKVITIEQSLDNAVQHINSIEFIQAGNTLKAVVDSAENQLVHIDTNNFLMWNNKISSSNASSILWWTGNEISWWSGSVIMAWSKNTLLWDSSVIWWWVSNKIEKLLKGSVIMWWLGNTIKLNSNNSTIVWWSNNTIRWDNSIIAWNNNMVNGNNSVALWFGSKVIWDKSFLWSDSSHNTELRENNVFAIESDGWLVVNANAAAEWAKLTIWWSIIIAGGANDDRAVCWGLNWKWLIKSVKNDSGTGDCLCTCNWETWNSLYWEWRCEAMCKGGNMSPQCGSVVEKIDLGDGTCTYSGSCEVWHMIMEHIYVDKDNYIHWVCQTSDGTVSSDCKAISNGGNCTPAGYTHQCGWTEPWWDGVNKWSSSYTEWYTPISWTYEKNWTLWACQWRCNEGYEQDWDGCKLGVGGKVNPPGGIIDDDLDPTWLDCSASWACPTTAHEGKCESYSEIQSNDCESKKIESTCNNWKWDKEPWAYSSCGAYSPCPASWACWETAHEGTCESYKEGESEICEKNKRISTCNNWTWDKEPRGYSGCVLPMRECGWTEPDESMDRWVGYSNSFAIWTYNANAKTQSDLWACEYGCVKEWYHAQKQKTFTPITFGGGLVNRDLQNEDVRVCVKNPDPKCTSLPSYAEANNSSLPSSDTAYFYDPNSTEACSYHCVDDAVYTGGRCRIVDHWEWRFYNNWTEIQSYDDTFSVGWDETFWVFLSRTDLWYNVVESNNWHHANCWNTNRNGIENLSAFMDSNFYSWAPWIITLKLSYFHNRGIPIVSKLPTASVSYVRHGLACEDLNYEFSSNQPSVSYLAASDYAWQEITLYVWTMHWGVAEWCNWECWYDFWNKNDRHAMVFIWGFGSSIQAKSVPIYMSSCKATTMNWFNVPKLNDKETSSFISQGSCKARFYCSDWSLSMQDYSCTGSQWSCFLAWTQVHMADWTTKNIEEIEIGDMVLTYNVETKENEYNKVLYKYIHENSIDDLYELTINGNLLKVTEAHRFYVVMDEDNWYQCPYNWVPAKKLKVWDVLLMKDGSYVTIDEINHYSNLATVYNLLVENNHNYYVDEWYLVHNLMWDTLLAKQENTLQQSDKWVI